MCGVHMWAIRMIFTAHKIHSDYHMLDIYCTVKIFHISQYKSFEPFQPVWHLCQIKLHKSQEKMRGITLSTYVQNKQIVLAFFYCIMKDTPGLESISVCWGPANRSQFKSKMDSPLLQYIDNVLPHKRGRISLKPIQEHCIVAYHFLFHIRL